MFFVDREKTIMDMLYYKKIILSFFVVSIFSLDLFSLIVPQDYLYKNKDEISISKDSINLDVSINDDRKNMIIAVQNKGSDNSADLKDKPAENFDQYEKDLGFYKKINELLVEQLKKANISKDSSPEKKVKFSKQMLIESFQKIENPDDKVELINLLKIINEKKLEKVNSQYYIYEIILNTAKNLTSPYSMIALTIIMGLNKIYNIIDSDNFMKLVDSLVRINSTYQISTTLKALIPLIGLFFIRIST